MRPEPSDWSRRGPGEDVLGGVVPVGMFLIQSERLVVGLSHVIAYPTGCTLEIRESSLDGDSLDIFDRMVFSARFGAVTARLYDKTAPASEWQWQSYPLQESIFRSIIVREVVIRAQGTGTITVNSVGFSSDPAPVVYSISVGIIETLLASPT